MTARSRRREAELAVIEAARRESAYWRSHYPDQSLVEPIQDLLKAMDQLNALDLEVPDAVLTGNDHPLTSSKAAEWMRRYASSVSMEVYMAIYWAWRGGGTGLTVDQLERRLGRSHQSVSPRVTDLWRKGYVRDSKLTLKTRTGNDAIVWTPTDTAIEASKQGGMPWDWSHTDSPTGGS